MDDLADPASVSMQYLAHDRVLDGMILFDIIGQSLVER